jgi:hypothetical protein
MLKNGLEFAPGTSEDCQKLVVRLFDPSKLFATYRMARKQLRTGDLVIVTEESDPEHAKVAKRLDYVAEIRAGAAKILPVLVIAQKSAHQVASLPFESDAFWLVILRGQQVPIDCVLYANPYEVAAEGEALVLGN